MLSPLSAAVVWQREQYSLNSDCPLESTWVRSAVGVARSVACGVCAVSVFVGIAAVWVGCTEGTSVKILMVKGDGEGAGVSAG